MKNRPDINDEDFSIPEIIIGFLIGVGLGFFIFFMFTNSHTPAMTCDDIDFILTEHITGKTILSDKEYNELMGVMNWCINKGFEVPPLGEE